MSPFRCEELGLSELDRKAASVFAGKVVRKDLVRKVKVGANVPVFVLEYLLGKYCATDDPVAIDAGLRVVNNTLSSNFVRPDEANKAQSMVKDKGKHIHTSSLPKAPPPRSVSRTTFDAPRFLLSTAANIVAS
jgi:predicted ATP-dependent Lon-type protease